MRQCVYSVFGLVDLMVEGCVNSLLIASVCSVKEGVSPPKNESRR